MNVSIHMYVTCQIDFTQPDPAPHPGGAAAPRRGGFGTEPLPGGTSPARWGALDPGSEGGDVPWWNRWVGKSWKKVVQTGKWAIETIRNHLFYCCTVAPTIVFVVESHQLRGCRFPP